MQVGLKQSDITTPPSPTAAARSATAKELTDSAAIKAARLNLSTPLTTRSKERGQDFPEHPLISTRPLRYNVQLNEQISAVQQADSYLRRTETVMLRLRHSLTSELNTKNSEDAAATLEQLLDNRRELSAGTVNRQLAVSLEGRSTVRFTLKESAQLQNSHSETLLFSLAGERRELVAIRLAGNSGNSEIMRQFNQGLGRWGVHASLDEKQQLTFSVAEAKWERISTQLSVCGEGHRYPAEFYPLALQEEPGRVDTLRNITRQFRQSHSYGKEFNQTLEQITEQRQALARSHHQVEQRLNSMNAYPEATTAEATSRQLAQNLLTADRSYATLSQALAAQANLRAFMVKNVL